mgnify:CR=1 FL=1
MLAHVHDKLLLRDPGYGPLQPELEAQLAKRLQISPQWTQVLAPVKELQAPNVLLGYQTRWLKALQRATTAQPLRQRNVEELKRDTEVD